MISVGAIYDRESVGSYHITVSVCRAQADGHGVHQVLLKNLRVCTRVPHRGKETDNSRTTGFHNTKKGTHIITVRGGEGRVVKSVSEGVVKGTTSKIPSPSDPSVHINRT